MENKPLLLIGGPFDLDGTEVPDTMMSVGVVKDFENNDQVYIVMRDWVLDRWVGRWQNTRQLA